MTTLRQINANRINSQNSTGPKSQEGKAASRANALKHGLAGEGIVMPDEEMEAIRERAQQWNSSFKPFNVFDVWLVDLVATEGVRVERCRVLEANLREEAARRAGESWDDDRALAAAKLASKLSAKPEIVALELATTTQGVDLLMERWRALGSVLKQSIWNEDERSLALDLLGIPIALRDAPTPTVIAVCGPGAGALVAQQLEKFLALKPTLDARDGREQGAAMLGLGAPCVELNRLRRYEATCLRRLQWGYSRLKFPAASPSHPAPVHHAETPSSPHLLVNGRLVDSIDEPSYDDDAPDRFETPSLPPLAPQSQASADFSLCQSG